MDSKDNMDNLTRFCKYTKQKDPRQITFEEIEIDTNIKYFIININKSKWIYTLHSCQGHKHNDKSSSLPYMIFIVDNNKIKEFLQLLYNTIPTHKFNPITPFHGAHELKIAQEYKDEHYTLISTYWDERCIDNTEFYDKLNNMANTVLGTGNTINNNNTTTM